MLVVFIARIVQHLSSKLRRVERIVETLNPHMVRHPRAQPPASGYRHKRASFIQRTFGFNCVPLTLVVILTYVGIIFCVTRIESSLEPPFTLELLRDHEIPVFEKVWTDLQHVSSTYHPYNSFANDLVHDYLVKTVRNIVGDAPNVEIDTDPQTILLEKDTSMTYFEANNVLVRLSGYDSSLPALLISAHYDSVPTGKGATDDGVGIATMLGILRSFIETPSSLRRDVIFNFNNNEEFGLLGAEAFIHHPWAKDVQVFLNLEGAGSGGKSILLQTTDYEVTKYYKHARSPSAGSIVQHGFQSGIVSSITDFNVYRNAGMRGIDIAFFKPRSWYHTSRDSIKDISRSSVAHMFVNAIDVARSLAESRDFKSTTMTGDLENSVYFDIFGRFFYAIPLSLWIVINGLFLTGGPLIITILYALVTKSHRWTNQASKRSLFAITFSVLAAIAVSQLYARYNPYIIVSDFVSPLLAMLSAFILVGATILGISDRLAPVPDQKLSVLLNLHNVWWLLLAASTYDQYTTGKGGLYLATEGYTKVLQAIVIGLIGWAIFGKRQISANEVVTVQFTNNSDETTPLLPAEEDAGSADVSEQEIEPSDNTVPPGYDWILQFATLAGTLYAIYYQYYVILDAVHMSVLDSSQLIKWMYAGIALYAALLGSLLLPFVHRLSVSAICLAAITAVWLTVQMSVSFPFNEQSPYKVRYLQKISLDRPETSLVVIQGVAVEKYLQPVLQDLTFVKESQIPVQCIPNKAYENGAVSQCQFGWNSIDEPFGSWLDVNYTSQPSIREKQSNNKAEISINATWSRLCRIDMDVSAYGTSPLRKITVNGNSSTLNNDMVKSLELRTLGWESPMNIQLEWASQWSEENGFITELPLTVSCKWSDLSEYAPYKIASYTYLQDSTPSWMILANLDAGMVIVNSKEIIL